MHHDRFHLIVGSVGNGDRTRIESSRMFEQEPVAQSTPRLFD
jgi:hypothetical protein